MSNLEIHAERELRSAGLFDKDSDYGGMIGEAVMKLVRVFSGEGHSGFSAEMTMQIFERVARFKTLSPLTDNPNEWMQISPDNWTVGETAWQSMRQGSCFSNDGGKTYYDIDAGDERKIRNSEPSKKTETV